jgi:hypothetical protein
MTTNSSPIIGKWRIVEIEGYDSDYADLVEPACILFDASGHGEFRLGVMVAETNGVPGQTIAHFRWGGSDEGDEVSGEGWAELAQDGSLEVELSFDNDDEMIIRTVRWSEPI